MSIAEVVEKLDNFSATPLVAIPDRNKSYKYYIINSSRNNTTKGPRLCRDNCGAWCGSCHTALYLKQSSKQQLQKIALFNQNKKINASAETIPPLPRNEDVISLYKYNCYFKSDMSFKRKIIIVVSKPHFAMVEYCRNFADPIEPHRPTEFSATAVSYIRTKPKIMERIEKTDDILTQTMASNGILKVRDRKVIINAKVRVKKNVPFRAPAPKIFADQI